MVKEVEILTPRKLKLLSSLVLRDKYLELADECGGRLQEIERLGRVIERNKEKAAEDLKEQQAKYEKAIRRIREGRDRRLKKYSLKAFRRQQQIFMLKRFIQRRGPIKKKVKVRKRELTKEAREQGYQKGLQRNILVKRKDAWRQGWKAGYAAARDRSEKERGGMVYRSAAVDSIAKCALMVNKLMEAVGLSPECISIMLLAGQYEAFLFEDLKSSFEQIEGNLFYKRMFFLKNRGYIHHIGTRNGRKVWALTPLGVEIHKRMKAYIGRNLKETYK